MSCEWEKIKGTGIDEPAVYRCQVSRSEEANEDCPNFNTEFQCCIKCICDCEEQIELNEAYIEEYYSGAYPEGTSVAGRTAP